MTQTKISQRNQKVAINRWKTIHTKEIDRLKNIENVPKYKLLKSKLMGYLVGDGGVYIRLEKRGNVHCSISFYPDDELMLNTFISAFNEYYNKIPTIKNLDTYYTVRCESKVIVEDLMKTAKYDALNWTIPLDYLETEEMIIEWIRAYFDCEAHVNSYSIRVQSVNEKGLIEIQKLLKRLDIDSSLYKYKRKNPNWNINYILSIQKKESRLNYMKKIGFNHDRKTKALHKYLLP